MAHIYRPEDVFEKHPSFLGHCPENILKRIQAQGYTTTTSHWGPRSAIWHDGFCVAIVGLLGNTVMLSPNVMYPEHQDILGQLIM